MSRNVLTKITQAKVYLCICDFSLLVFVKPSTVVDQLRLAQRLANHFGFNGQYPQVSYTAIYSYYHPGQWDPWNHGSNISLNYYTRSRFLSHLISVAIREARANTMISEHQLCVILWHHIHYLVTKLSSSHSFRMFLWVSPPPPWKFLDPPLRAVYMYSSIIVSSWLAIIYYCICIQVVGLFFFTFHNYCSFHDSLMSWHTESIITIYK